MNWLSLISGSKGLLIVGLLAFAAGGIAMRHYDNLQADRGALARERIYTTGIKLTNAANEAAHAAELADRERALAAVEATAAAERERADALAGQLEAIKAIPDAENCALGLETMKILEGLM